MLVERLSKYCSIPLDFKAAQIRFTTKPKSNLSCTSKFTVTNDIVKINRHGKNA